MAERKLQEIITELLFRIKFAKEYLDCCLAYNEIRNNISYLNVYIQARSYMTVTNRATVVALMMELAKLCETTEKKKEAQSFNRFLNRCITSSELSRDKKKEIEPIINLARETWESYRFKEIRNRIIFRRDKLYAHYDKGFFLDEDRALDCGDINYEDIKDLIALMHNTCEEVFCLLSGRTWSEKCHQKTYEPDRNCFDVLDMLGRTAE